MESSSKKNTTPAPHGCQCYLYAAECDDCRAHRLKNTSEKTTRDEFLSEYPADWAKGIDLDKLRNASDDKLRAILTQAVRDGMTVQAKHGRKS